ncbi:hypothetical protein BDD43_0945 [Mucilaginibacter gracilis]|uniref:Uncharacterized protein n=1 Tax=Mucilaginibacter gracilis TaxID=423350 RepID=A0A495IVR0_9SPHI|nr:hypothetical protein [Mucilaginibacter gracilis]RKR80810.1 hypothetical protein BDD43_0945 [Mucilaginibacter gracilis]
MFNPSEHSGHRKKKLFFVPVIILLLFALGTAVQFLWNAILPAVIHAAPVTYWQALGLLVLCRILFGRLHFGPRGAKTGWGGAPQHLREKWMNMNDEEREKFRAEFKERCRYKRQR